MMIFPKAGGAAVPPPPAIAAMQAIGEAEIAPMVARHAVLRALCRELEDCANRLPDNHVIRYAAVLSAGLAAQLRECEMLGRMVWSRMFGMDCEAMAAGPDGGWPERMRQYHSADALHAEDLHDELLRSVANARRPGAEQIAMLGYMMRCLFDGCRRCIDCREAALLLLGRDRMSAAAAAALTASLNSH